MKFNASFATGLATNKAKSGATAIEANPLYPSVFHK